MKQATTLIMSMTFLVTNLIILGLVFSNYVKHDPLEPGPANVSYYHAPSSVQLDAAPPAYEQRVTITEPAPQTDLSMDDLWHAVCMVESSGNPKAHRTINNEDSRGIAQIRSIMVRDVNRIIGDDKYVHNDAWDVTKSREMFEIFANHYFLDGSFEQIARAWNGGPAGPRKESTLHYWTKIQRHL